MILVPVAAILAGVVVGIRHTTRAKAAAAAADFAEAEAAHVERMEERRREAIRADLAERVRQQDERIEDQAAVRAAAQRLWEARREADDAAFRLKQAQDAAMNPGR